MGEPTRVAVEGHDVELVPERLYRLGGLISLRGTISWVPKAAVGHLPVNCYLLRENASWLLVDTGVPAHAAQIGEQLHRLVPSEEELQLYVTRIEPDVVSNLRMLTNHFGVEKVYGGGVMNPFDYFDDLSAEAHIQADSGLRLIRMSPDSSVELAATRPLKLVPTALRLLYTFWAYDSETKTMFTSDSFGHAYLNDPSEQPVVTSANDTSTLDQVRAHLLTKFDWLQGADTDVIHDDVARIFETYDVEIIAPSSGMVLQGKDVVDRHVGMVKQVLLDLYDDQT